MVDFQQSDSEWVFSFSEQNHIRHGTSQNGWRKTCRRPSVVSFAFEKENYLLTVKYCLTVTYS